MYLDKKPMNGVLYGIIMDTKGISYDIYYISNPTIIQKMYYRNFKSHFYIGVANNNINNCNYTSFCFPYILNNVNLPLPLKKRTPTISNLFIGNNVRIGSPISLHNKSYIRNYRKTYPEL
jgi:hypothetical protein